MRIIIIIFLILLRSNPEPSLPKFVIDGDIFMYKNSDRSELVIMEL